jgi:hypothetical protein
MLKLQAFWLHLGSPEAAHKSGVEGGASPRRVLNAGQESTQFEVLQVLGAVSHLPQRAQLHKNWGTIARNSIADTFPAAVPLFPILLCQEGHTLQ